MRLLIVKLSSLGDVVHALPALQDIRSAYPAASIDWVVEPGFAPLLRRVEGIGRVIELPLRRWAGGWWKAGVRAEFGRFRTLLQSERYDAVLDLQGLTKSVLVARLARLAPGGHRYGLANRTDGAGWERPARWWVDRPVPVPRRIHAMDRSRVLAADALGYSLAQAGPPRYGLRAKAVAPLAPVAANAGAAATPGALAVPVAPTVAFVHGSSRGDKCWPLAHWLEFGRRVLREPALTPQAPAWRIALPQGNAAERERALALQAAWLESEGVAVAGRIEVWPTLGLDAVLDRLAATQGVVGVDSGLSHLAVALGLPHVQLYNLPTSWRTGPQAAHGQAHQCALEGDPVSPAHGPSLPSVDAVWQAWQRVRSAAVTAPVEVAA